MIILVVISALLFFGHQSADAFSTLGGTHQTGRSAVRLGASSDSEIYVVVNGMPGPMATAAAEAVLRKGMKLAPIGMTGPDVPAATITVVDSVTERHADVRLVPSSDLEEMKSSLEGVRTSVGAKNVLAIDYTHPSAVNSNALFYVEQKLPFVMGTTGGDRDKLISDVDSAKHFAVIAPNMGKQIVAMQSALEDLASKYPSAFAGYKLEVTESHQKTKADTSGTAKAVIDSIKKLSDDDFEYDDISMIRDDQEAMEFGVPEEGLKGHAFHTYTLTSSDGSVQFQLQHNVVGRTVYAEGTADAVKYLAKKLQTEDEGRIYTMIDVLEAGALE